ncbi:hypothetical protein OKW43_000119 [Paraburkholderia sp. WC7.3g]
MHTGDRDVLADLGFNFEAVVDEELLAGLDVSECADEYPIACLDCLAVGNTGMIQRALLPPRLPSITLRRND